MRNARRTSFVLASAVAVALLMLLVSNSAAAAMEVPSQEFLSKRLKAQVKAEERHRVMCGLAAAPLGAATGNFLPTESPALLVPHGTQATSSSGNQLREIKVESTTLALARSRSLQSQIPYGLAAIVWGFRHPSEAWRLFLPVKSSANHEQPSLYAAGCPDAVSAGLTSIAARLP